MTLLLNAIVHYAATRHPQIYARMVSLVSCSEDAGLDCRYCRMLRLAVAAVLELRMQGLWFDQRVGGCDYGGRGDRCGDIE